MRSKLILGLVLVLSALAVALLNRWERIPSKLAHQLARADRIVIRWRLPDAPPELSGFSYSVTGDKVHEIVSAISSAKRGPDTVSVWGWELRFYNDTNLLATVDFQDDVFLTEGGEYYDKSGVLAQLDHDLYIYSRTKSKAAPPDNALQASPFVQDGIRIVSPIRHAVIYGLLDDGGTGRADIVDADDKKFIIYTDRRAMPGGNKTYGDVYLNAYPARSNSVHVLNQLEFRQKIGDFDKGKTNSF